MKKRCPRCGQSQFHIMVPVAMEFDGEYLNPGKICSDPEPDFDKNDCVTCSNEHCDWSGRVCDLVSPPEPITVKPKNLIWVDVCADCPLYEAATQEEGRCTWAEMNVHGKAHPPDGDCGMPFVIVRRTKEE